MKPLIIIPQHQPPSLDSSWLTYAMLQEYPSHAGSEYLIDELIVEYIKLWQLFYKYPEKRIVAPGPIIAVHEVHRLYRSMYFNHCMKYFQRFIYKEFSWHGKHDARGAIDTVHAYIDFYDEFPPDPWNDINEVYELGKSNLRVIK